MHDLGNLVLRPPREVQTATILHQPLLDRHLGLVAFFWLLAFSSATHDIAADGFYMLALPQRTQAAFVGVRSTCFRLAMIAGQGGLGRGGLNFDAKVRRESFEPVDLFYAHIGGMDAFARGLKIASAIRKDGRLAHFVKQRYASWDSGIGADIEKGKVGFKELETYMLKKGDVTPNVSGRQEMLENLINEFI